MAKLNLRKNKKTSDIKVKKFDLSCFKLTRNSIKTRLIIFVCVMSLVVVLLLEFVNSFDNAYHNRGGIGRKR